MSSSSRDGGSSSSSSQAAADPQQQLPPLAPQCETPSSSRSLTVDTMTGSDVYALEDDIRSIGSQMKRVLAYCEAQSQSPIRLQAKINELQDQLQAAIAEKNYWMKRYKEVANKTSGVELSKDLRTFNNRAACSLAPACWVCYEISRVSLVFGAEYVKSYRRKRTNSELILIADTLGSPGEGIYNEDTTSSAGESDSSSTESPAFSRSQFRLLQCSDEQCEVFTPMNRSIRTQHRARNNVQFMWDEPPKTVLLVKKPNEPHVTDTLVRQAFWLMKERKVQVYLEPVVHKELAIPGTKTWESQDDWEDCQTSIDFVVSLGGDGTVLWVSSLFKKSVPPVISFAMGSLGFLTPFDIAKDTGTLPFVCLTNADWQAQLIDALLLLQNTSRTSSREASTCPYARVWSVRSFATTRSVRS